MTLQIIQQVFFFLYKLTTLVTSNKIIFIAIHAWGKHLKTMLFFHVHFNIPFHIMVYITTIYIRITSRDQVKCYYTELSSLRKIYKLIL
jgi:hypothetical protein